MSPCQNTKRAIRESLNFKERYKMNEGFKDVSQVALTVEDILEEIKKINDVLGSGLLTDKYLTSLNEFRTLVEYAHILRREANPVLAWYRNPVGVHSSETKMVEHLGVLKNELGTVNLYLIEFLKNAARKESLRIENPSRFTSSNDVIDSRIGYHIDELVVEISRLTPLLESSLRSLAHMQFDSILNDADTIYIGGNKYDNTMYSQHLSQDDVIIVDMQEKSDTINLTSFSTVTEGQVEFARIVREAAENPATDVHIVVSNSKLDKLWTNADETLTATENAKASSSTIDAVLDSAKNPRKFFFESRINKNNDTPNGAENTSSNEVYDDSQLYEYLQSLLNRETTPHKSRRKRKSRNS